MERPGNIYKDVQALQTYSTRLNLKQYTKQQLAYACIFICHYDDLTQLQKDMRFWYKNGVHKLYKNPLQRENTM